MQTGTPIFDRFACYGYNLSYINYQLTYSDSYSALPIISDFPYVISMLAAFDSFLMDTGNYHAYILTLELYTVAIDVNNIGRRQDSKYACTIAVQFRACFSKHNHEVYYFGNK